MEATMDFSQRQQVLISAFPSGKKVLPIELPFWFILQEEKSRNHEKVKKFLRAYA